MKRIDRRDRIEALRAVVMKDLREVQYDSVIYRHLKNAEFSLYCARALMSAPDKPDPVRIPEVLREQIN